jgi:hypothetical protein
LIPGRGRDFSFLPSHVDQHWAIPASYAVDTGAVSVGVKWLGHEADHLPPSYAEVKNAWGYTNTPPYVFIAWCLIITQGYIFVALCLAKHRDKFTFNLPTGH